MRTKCQYLSGKYMRFCSVSREPYVPSAFELGEYCATGRHQMCPFYQKKEFDLPMQKRADELAGMRR